MAKVTVRHTCGHEVSHTVPEAGGEKRLNWLKQQPCQVCFHEQQLGEASAQNEALDLPELEGRKIP